MRFRNYVSLRNCLAVARHLNMGVAARELNLTKGAISYQVRQLEDELGFAVFSRQKRSLALTEKGAELIQLAQSSFDNLERRIVDLRQAGNDRVTIGMATYFASRWLSPRLMNFIGDHPDIGLRIQPLIDLTDLRSHELDLAVRWGKGDWEDAEFETELIFRCPAMLTASTAIGRQIDADGVESVLQRYPLLHDRDGSRAWMDWFEAAGMEWSPGSGGLMIPDPNVRVQAVIDGQGLALYDFLIEDEVGAGRLYQYRSVSMDEYGFYLLYPRDADPDSAIGVFRDWIIREARIG